MTDTLDRVKTYQQFIGGSFVDAADGRTAEVINPANDQVIGTVPASSAEDVDRAVNAADEAFQTWRKTTPQDRSLLLLKVADLGTVAQRARHLVLRHFVLQLQATRREAVRCDKNAARQVARHRHMIRQ